MTGLLPKASECVTGKAFLRRPHREKLEKIGPTDRFIAEVAMRLRHWPILVAISLVILCVARGAIAAIPDATYQAERQKAAELFHEGRRLEALPLLEQLVKPIPEMTKY